MITKLLTKTLFIIGLECPRKLYYTAHPEIYANKKLEDEFLKSLADGGFQVGALAKIYHPEGVDLNGLATTEGIIKTTELLKQDKVTIFEAAISTGNLLIRADILEKDGNTIYLYEVKAKSFHSLDDTFIDGRNKQFIKARWSKYLCDVAYQTHVLRQYNPSFEIRPYLTLVNRNIAATVDGLNQRFKLKKNKDGRTEVIVLDGTNKKNAGAELLINVDVSKEVSGILDDSLNVNKTNVVDLVPFTEKIHIFEAGILHDQKLTPRLDKECKKCEFRCARPLLKSGFEECWGMEFSCTDDFVFDVWSYRAEKVLKSGKVKMSELLETDFKIEVDEGLGLTNSGRQWLQVKSSKDLTSEAYLDKNYLRNEMGKWQYPLHFIDFETASVAIPFNAGRRPYEPIAFQFSHHVINADGSIEHKGEYLNAQPGAFPNFHFVRHLKSELENDSGTIFRYSPYENSILCCIIDQLNASDEQDKEELITWIRTITTKTDQWSGLRTMVDLREIVVRSFYHPLLKGSNSLKHVLPTILAISPFLQTKYSQSIYGSVNGIRSLNFTDQAWVRRDNSGGVMDPYSLLPALFKDMDGAIETLYEDEDIKHGGAAMTAYAKLQFAEMSDEERKELVDALLKYCELDTFAMVLLHEYFNQAVGGTPTN